MGMGGAARLAVAAATAIALLAACSGAQDHHPNPSPHVATPGLRGAAVAATDCQAPKPRNVTEPIEAIVPVPSVSALTLCRQAGSLANGNRVLVPGQPGFASVVDAWANSAPERYCLSYADSLLEVLATTSRGTYWLEVPHDQCGHYVRGPFDAFAAEFQ
jgi:hypothetical protein